MIDFEYKDYYNIDDLKRLVKLLRGENGCPWDREQTHESITRDFLEEAYEAVEAIEEGSTEHLKEELGDVLLQVVFHSDIEEDAGNFTLDDAADGVVKKLILRHPHVFGDVTVTGSEEVLSNWDDIKRREKKQETVTDAMNAVARSLPATWRSEKVGKKAAKVGFDWDFAGDVVKKLREETDELEAAILGGGDVFEELGDVLASAVNIARKLKIDPEEALNASTDKFIRRFEKMEQAAAREGLDLRDMTLPQLDKLWDEAKELLK